MTSKRVYRSLFVAALLSLLIATGFCVLKSGSFAIGRAAATGITTSSVAAHSKAGVPGATFSPVSATATVSAPATVPLGQPFNFDVQFANTSGVTGYGPYVNLFMPSSGVDGNDGYTFNGATYLGAPVTTTTLSCPSGGSLTSPLTGLTVSCPVTPSGQPSQLVILQLPFGSVTVGQPLAPLQISATMSNLADVGTPLPISAQAGFLYGDSPTGSMPSQGATNTANVTPSLLMMTKVYNGPEGETATGPNYPRSYSLTPSMPPGLTATNVMVTDTLPDNIVFLGLTGAGFSVNTQPPIGSLVTAPNNQLKVTYASFTGTASPVTVNFYVAQNNSTNGNPVVNPLTGAPGSTSNQATAMGTWTPVDPRDGGAQTVSAISGIVTITDRSLAIQKSVSNATPPASPGDVLTYRLDFQVSDFFTMKNIIVMDTLGDGQDYNPGSVSLNVTDRNGNVTGTFPAGNFTVQNNIPAAGQTKLTFDVSAAMVALGAADGTLQGGRAILPNAGAAQGFITFTATIRDTYKVAPMGPLLSGDTVSNSTMASGDVVPNNNITAPPTGTITDGSSASVMLIMPTLQKSVYAFNGSTTIPNPFRISPGDQVTFRLTYNLPSGDYRNTVIRHLAAAPVQGRNLDQSDIQQHERGHPGNWQCAVRPGQQRRAAGHVANHHAQPQHRQQSDHFHFPRQHRRVEYADDN